VFEAAITVVATSLGSAGSGEWSSTCGNRFDSQMCLYTTPILIAGPKRSGRAKVASELADKGFCASKNLYFYGVKLHCVGSLRQTSLPRLRFIELAPASANDHTMFEQVSGDLTPAPIFADKAYKDKTHSQILAAKQITLLTPNKKQKGLFTLPGGETFSTWVSQTRQPTQSLFSWIAAKTDIQTASKVRSLSGLMVHTFGKLAAIIMLTTRLQQSG